MTEHFLLEVIALLVLDVGLLYIYLYICTHVHNFSLFRHFFTCFSFPRALCRVLFKTGRYYINCTILPLYELLL